MTLDCVGIVADESFVAMLVWSVCSFT